MGKTMVQIHADALGCDNVIYHEFLLSYKINEQIVYGFVEGKDDPTFYRGFIENQLPEGWDVKLIISGNRDKVLASFRYMDWTRFPMKRVCFFVDRDLSEFTAEKLCSAPNLYVTDNYSIENDIVTLGTLERVLEEVLGITQLNSREVDKIKNIFRSNDITFREAMVPVMAQILLWRHYGERANLNNVRPLDFFKFTEAKIKLKETYCDPFARVQYFAGCVNGTMSPSSDLEKAKETFREKQGFEKYIRGKYLFDMFVKCALEIHSNISLFCEKYDSPPKTHVGLGVGNGMAIIAPRARCPPSLREFIACNYSEYIKDQMIAS